MQVVSLKCPECSASLEVEEGRDRLFCQYCGAKIVVQNENERVYRHIDEADVKRSETERLIRLKELEMEAAKRAEEKAATVVRVKISLGLLALSVVMMVAGVLLGDASGDSNSGFYLISMVGLMLLMCTGLPWMFGMKKDD